jgi:hypothetical protein
MLRLLVLLAFATPAFAEGKVALLPLDSTAKLEVYGQVIAAEIAKTLRAGSIDVVVVLPKMAVPDEAKLVVDGKISQGKGAAIELTLRIREPKSTKYFREFAPATAASLEKLETTTKDLAETLLPVLREKLVELAKASAEPKVTPPPVDTTPRVAPARPLLVGIGAKSPSDEALRAALAETVPGWVSRAHRAASVIEVGTLAPKSAAQTVAGSNADRAIAFEVLSYKLWGKSVPMGSARVRVRIADAGKVLFDRIVHTNTVVGNKDMQVDRFAELVANEVLSILRPHVRKAVPAWP